MDPTQAVTVVDEVMTLGVPELVRLHGDWFYLITFIWTMLEGETFVIFAGMAAFHGYLEPHWLVLSAWLGSFAGDQVCFYLGRRYGARALDKFPKLQKPRHALIKWIEKHTTAFILSYRFMYGLRNISAIMLGMTSISWARFAALNFAAAFLWSVSFVAMGYIFADTAKDIVESSAVGITIAIVLVFAFALTVRAVTRHVMDKVISKSDGAG
ncbi:MAG: DedA family protein [Alphaproteobacteria bacterium]|nr:DedA family protein [Alphaproteobacteria bacterium]